ncbi:hypothetical protein ACWD25_46505, partial [Streptomyces sp. NPDC002920]
VVVSASSALPEVIGAAGAVAADTGAAFADAVESLLERSEAERREEARARAECFGWGTAVEAFLAAHDATVPARPLAVGRSGTGAPGAGYASGPERPDVNGSTGRERSDAGVATVLARPFAAGGLG